MGTAFSQPPIPCLSAPALDTMSRLFSETAETVRKREQWLPRQLARTQYFCVPPGALTLFRDEDGEVKVVQHLGNCVGYTSAGVRPQDLGLMEMGLLHDATANIRRRETAMDLSQMRVDAGPPRSTSGDGTAPEVRRPDPAVMPKVVSADRSDAPLDASRAGLDDVN